MFSSSNQIACDLFSQAIHVSKSFVATSYNITQLQCVICLEESVLLSEVAKYYFDGHGKALRPVLTSTMASAVNHHLHRDPNDEVLPCTVNTFI